MPTNSDKESRPATSRGVQARGTGSSIACSATSPGNARTAPGTGANILAPIRPRSRNSTRSVQSSYYPETLACMALSQWFQSQPRNSVTLVLRFPSSRLSTAERHGQCVTTFTHCPPEGWSHPRHPFRGCRRTISSQFWRGSLGTCLFLGKVLKLLDITSPKYNSYVRHGIRFGLPLLLQGDTVEKGGTAAFSLFRANQPASGCSTRTSTDLSVSGPQGPVGPYHGAGNCARRGP